MLLTLIAAMSENRVIGRDGDLPWSLPDDMKHFMQTTRGHVVIMGRKTWDSMDGRPLPKRRNIVVTRSAETAERIAAGGGEAAESLEAAIELARTGGGPADWPRPKADEPVFVIGGGGIYRLALPMADRLDVTIVHAEIDGDTTFPQWSGADWRLISEEPHATDERHAYAFTFRLYERANASS